MKMENNSSLEDLQYQAIKEHFGNKIIAKIERLAKNRMSPQKLAVLLIRLIMTIKLSSSKRFVSNPSVRQIRNWAKKSEIKQFVEEQIIRFADKILKNLDAGLAELPPHHVMNIINKKPDIYLLLMFMSYKSMDLKSLKVANLAILLYFFALDIPACVNAIFRTIDEYDLYYDVEEIFEMLKDEVTLLIAAGKIRKVFKPTEAFQNPNDFRKLMIYSGFYDFISVWL